MKHLILFTLTLVSISIAVSAQQVRYDFAAPNAVHHEAEILVTVTGLQPGPALFRMSRSSPGRYATHEFGKNVYNVSATDAQGHPLPLVKKDADQYSVSQHKGIIKLHYTLYGNYADGTYASIDGTGYHLNMPATFMWVKGMEEAPISLHFEKAPADWQVATQLKPGNDPWTFTAPNLQYFMDSPTKTGKLHIREWKVTNPDQKTYTIRLALEAEARESLVDSFANKLKKIVQQAKAVYGEVPAFDYGTYTFIASLNPYVHGDGMEHRNSTMISSGRLFDGSDNFLTTFAHEFFHAWNVERIRPASLEPFNFEKSNMSEALWIAEGFTQYYGWLLMKRAGFTSDSSFAQQLAVLVNAKENTPGGQYYTPIENSQRAVFVDAGVAVDKTNYPNMFTSYYLYGGALAFALDMQLRKDFGKSLDGFMQLMWKQFGKTAKPYTLPQVKALLATYSNQEFAQQFFNSYVYAHSPVDFNTLIKAAGYQLQLANPDKAWMGNVSVDYSKKQLQVISPTIRNTPLYNAGVDVDDILMELDGQPLQQLPDISTVLEKHVPGDMIPLVYRHHNDIHRTTITLQQNPAVVLIPASELSDVQKKFRNQWLGEKE